MAYHELIKNFDRIRDYMRDFYVYGFKSRDEYTAKSARSYDNERRRIESWLANYMFFHQGAGGKNIFLSVDSRSISRNPLYNAFKAKSFTSLDITLHFIILDLLADGRELSVRQITENITENYFAAFAYPPLMDESTVRKKLKEYESLGLIKSAKGGKELLYSRVDDNIDLCGWRDALAFFAEADPLGVVGSYLLDKLDDAPDYYSFKHHYILYALESEMLYALLLAISERRSVELSLFSSRMEEPRTVTVLPLKIHISSQGGRRYLMAYNWRAKKITLHRLDSIRAVKPLEPEAEYEKYLGFAQKYLENLWGASPGADYHLDHIEMLIQVNKGEEHIPQRLQREKRCGQVEKLDNSTYKFTADVYDAGEMLPWLRTFIGRILSLKCSNQAVVDTFLADIAAMRDLYGGDDDAVS